MSSLGTELKINVHADPVGGLHMSDYEFDCEFFVFPSRKVMLKKADMMEVDPDNYIAAINSEDAIRIGSGNIRLEFTAYIPDEDFRGGVRTEKTVVCTDAVIV